MKIKTQQNLGYTLKPVLREKFLDSLKPSKLNQEKINQHPKQTCNNEEIEVIIKAFPLERFQAQMGSQQDTARRPYIYNILLKLFDGGESERQKNIFPTPSQSQNFPISKPSKNTRQT